MIHIFLWVSCCFWLLLFLVTVQWIKVPFTAAVVALGSFLHPSVWIVVCVFTVWTLLFDQQIWNFSKKLSARRGEVSTKKCTKITSIIIIWKLMDRRGFTRMEGRKQSLQFIVLLITNLHCYIFSLWSAFVHHFCIIENRCYCLKWRRLVAINNST